MTHRSDVYIHGIKTRWFDGLVPYNNFKEILSYVPGIPREKIIAYCKDYFQLEISRREFRTILRKKSYYSKNSFIIIMAIYNILKDEAECNDQCLNCLEDYINKNRVNSQSYSYFTLGNRPLKIIDNAGKLDRKYDTLIHYLDYTYNIVKLNTQSSNIYEICHERFPFSKFKRDDFEKLKTFTNKGGVECNI